MANNFHIGLKGLKPLQVTRIGKTNASFMIKKIFDTINANTFIRRPLAKVGLLRIFAIIISVLPILTSCNKEHSVTSIEEADQLKIKLGCSVGTKAVVNSKEGLISQMRANDKGFGIVGFKMVTNPNDPDDVETTRLFDNFEVKPVDDAASSWAYSPVRYWDTRSNILYQFIGYWPRLGNTANSDQSISDPYVTINNNDKVLTIHNIPNWQRVALNDQGVASGSGSEIDFLTSIREGSYADFNSDVVDLTFSHLLSKFTIKAYYIGPEVEVTQENPYGVRIKKITLQSPGENDKNVLDGVKNTDNSKPASTDFKRSTTDLLATQVTTDQDVNANTVDMVNSYVLFNEESANIQYKDEINDENNPDFTPTTVAQWLMIPHVWKDVQFVVEYAKGSSDASDTKTQESSPVTIGKEYDDYATLPGHSYTVTLYFDVSNSGLKVESVAVEEWTEHNVTREFYNW